MSSTEDADKRTTEQMLAELECGTAAEVIMAARYTNAPPGQTYIPALDDLIRTARGSELSTLRRGDMLEIIGPSGSGKTAFAHFLILPRILPSAITIDLPGPTSPPITIPLGGRHDQVTLICPTTHRHPITTIARKLTSHIESHVLDALTAAGRSRIIGPALRTYLDLAVRESLSQIRIVRIKPRWRHLYLALRTILNPPELIVGGETRGEGGVSQVENRRVDMLIIDGFADGFWAERWRSEEKALERKNGGPIRDADDIGVKDVLGLLESLRKEMGTVVVLTLQALWPQDQLYATHLPPPYPAPFNPEREDSRPWPLNIQITLKGRKAQSQRPADQLLVEALREGTTDGGQELQVFEGVLRVPGGLGSAATVEGVRFDFHLGPTGVEVWL